MAHRLWVPGLRFHDLRHGHATLSIAAGVDLKTVSSRLGHFSASFTLDQYAHALKELDDDEPGGSVT